MRSRTYEASIFLRGFFVNGDPRPAVENTKRSLRVYPLARAANPPAMSFVNISGQDFNTIPANDASFFDEVAHVVQEEPLDAVAPETRGLLAAIGIRNGTPFAPDARMKAALAEAAAVGNATARVITFRPFPARSGGSACGSTGRSNRGSTRPGGPGRSSWSREASRALSTCSQTIVRGRARGDVPSPVASGGRVTGKQAMKTDLREWTSIVESVEDWRPRHANYAVAGPHIEKMQSNGDELRNRRR